MTSLIKPGYKKKVVMIMLIELATAQSEGHCSLVH